MQCHAAEMAERIGSERMLIEFGSGRGRKARLLIGLDLQKDIDLIEAAYNDRKGITAQFNFNLLRRINRQLNADLEVHHARADPGKLFAVAYFRVGSA